MVLATAFDSFGRWIGPSPSCDFGLVDPVREGIPAARYLLVAEFFLRMTANLLQFRYAIDRIDGKSEAIGLVADRQFQWRVDVALLLVAANVQSPVLSAVRQTVNQPWISMEIEDDWRVRCE